MLVGVHGTLEAVGEGFAVVRAGAFSVKVLVPVSAVPHLGAVGDEVNLHTYLHVREDALTLYGFPSEASQRMFTALLDVSGVGPKLALAVLAREPAEVAAAIAGGDEATLSRIPGIGKKTAARIVLELKSKMQKEWSDVSPSVPSASPGDDEVVGFLMALGYTQLEARQAVAGIPGGDKLPVEERVRLALQGMDQGGKKR